MEGGRLPYSGARGWGRDGGSGLGLMPCGRGPEAQASWGSNSPEACRKGLHFPFPIFHDRRAAAPGAGAEPPRHGPGVTGGSMSSAQQ